MAKGLIEATGFALKSAVDLKQDFTSYAIEPRGAGDSLVAVFQRREARPEYMHGLDGEWVERLSEECVLDEASLVTRIDNLAKGGRFYDLEASALVTLRARKNGRNFG